MKKGRPITAQPTLTAMYREITGDLESHQRTIGAHFRNLEPRRKRIIVRRLKGQTLAYIGECFGVTAAAAGSSLKLAMRAIAKAIAGSPRYHLAGRPTGYTRKDHRAPAPEELMERVHAGAEARAAKKARRTG